MELIEPTLILIVTSNSKDDFQMKYYDQNIYPITESRIWV